MEEKNYTIALLIDTENVSSKYMKSLYNELIALGKITYKRMYGDFTKSNASGWKKLINEFSITPIQQFTYTTGKNATDFSIIIDAMDILYSKNVDAFCIMTSDSDFTGLAKRLKESNMFIIGAGESKTPVSFVKSCDRFFRLDKLSETKEEIKCVKKSGAKEEIITELGEDTSIGEVSKQCKKEDIEKLSIKILESNDGKPYALATLVSKIYQAFPEFNFKDFGARKAMDFFSKDLFVITTIKSQKYISLKN